MREKPSPITVYWSTSAFSQETESWSFLYREPKSLLSLTRSMRPENARPMLMFSCPSTIEHMSNIFVFSNAITDIVQIPAGVLEQSNSRTEENYRASQPLPIGNKLSFLSSRESSLDGYANITYNLSWVFFASEPLVAKFTAPYYPPTAPCPGAMLSTGKFDIGSWYRPFVLDYHIPLNTKELSFKENDHLFYMELETERPVVFKRYIENPRLNSIQQETVYTYKEMFGKFRPLKKRYEDSKRAKIPQIVLSEIQKNLVE